VSRLVEIHLGGPTAYTDHPPIPERFSRDFKLWIFDPDEGGGMKVHERVLNEGERDVVSEAIGDLGVWEVPETITLSSAFAAAQSGTAFLDIGSHVGWFSAIAGTYGLHVTAVDADAGALELLEQTWEENDFESELKTINTLVDENLEWELPVAVRAAIVKMDIEGAERHAVSMLWPWFEDGTITHCLMEVSPCFNDTYPALLGSLFDLGFVGHVMPRKRQQPKEMDEVYSYLSVYGRRLDVLTRHAMSDWIGQQHQFDIVVFRPAGARWG
jgi:antitoxin component HigA of HigAB toxin-antitoxin module